ncbi:TIGR01212 family radical SAM protein [Lacticigenium naphthae]|uniref:TIGR01212 family radical SAM protein n=1 Tax=Lacticigenium naphthae TaxID=515351 RepID=UPI00042A097A|nr:TIGR01212 family radical SAM protein [Lacticigenium naphthae]
MSKSVLTQNDQKRYYTWNKHLKETFGEKVFKVALDGGFDCPNRDGTVAYGGCTFCSVSGSGDFAQDRVDPLPIQFRKGVDMMHKKWPSGQKYIAYFQNFTNTHAPVEILRHRFEQVVNEEGIVGIMIATRPDCLPDETVAYLSELNKRFYLWVELGLQTIHEETSEKINRAHSYETYLEAVRKLRKHDIQVVTHLISGLPGETVDMMIENVERMILDSDIQGVKLHLLHLMKNTKMVRDYAQGRLEFLEKDTYVQLICDQLERIPKDIVIHRLTGDAPRDTLIGPEWSLKKWEVLNAIDAEMARRQTTQGAKDVRSGLHK